MNAYRIVWEDESKAREVELFVEYTLVASVTQIGAIRPTKVTFYNNETKQIDRVMGVYTDAGRQLLAKQYLGARADQPTMEEEILAQHQLRDEDLAQSSAL